MAYRLEGNPMDTCLVQTIIHPKIQKIKKKSILWSGVRIVGILWLFFSILPRAPFLLLDWKKLARLSVNALSWQSASLLSDVVSYGCLMLSAKKSISLEHVVKNGGLVESCPHRFFLISCSSAAIGPSRTKCPCRESPDHSRLLLYVWISCWRCRLHRSWVHQPVIIEPAITSTQLWTHYQVNSC